MFLEVVLSQCKDLKNALSTKNDNEAHVQIVQGKAPHWTLMVVIEGHGQHIQSNEDHDDHIKLLVGHDAKHYRLRFPLKIKQDIGT